MAFVVVCNRIVVVCNRFVVVCNRFVVVCSRVVIVCSRGVVLWGGVGRNSNVFYYHGCVVIIVESSHTP